MKASITTLTLLAAVASTSAFAPASPAFTRVATPLSAEADAAAAKTEKKELVLDTDFENVNVVKLLGLQRLKKKARKNKSTTNGGK